MSSDGSAATSKRPIYSWLRIGALLGVLIWQSIRLTDSSFLGVTDFVEYWCAARLNVTGGNPYSPEQMLPLQESVGWDSMAKQGVEHTPMMMQNPPWTLSLLLPLTVFGFGTGKVVWLIAHLVLVFVAIELSWKFYSGTSKQRLLYWIVGLSFFPALIVLRMGQIVPVMAVGLAGFMHFERSRRDWSAGAMLTLVSIKPHLVYLVWPALLVWIIVNRRWRILAGAILATTGALAIPMLWNPNLLSQYFHALFNQPPTTLIQLPTPTFGTVLGAMFGSEQRWTRFASTIVGFAWLAWFLSRHWRNWDWGVKMPVLILVSVMTTFYMWPFDLVLYLIPLMQVTTMLARDAKRSLCLAAVALHVSINVAGLVLAIFKAHSFWFFWMPPALVLSYFLICERLARKQEHMPSELKMA